MTVHMIVARGGITVHDAAVGQLSRPEGEALEHAGEHLCIVDNDNRVASVVFVERVEAVAFSAVTWQFMDAEGEASPPSRIWRDGH